MSVILSLAIFCATAAQAIPRKSADSATAKSASTAAKRAPAPARVGQELEKAAHTALRRWAQSASKDLQPAGAYWPSTRTCNATPSWPSPPGRSCWASSAIGWRYWPKRSGNSSRPEKWRATISGKRPMGTRSPTRSIPADLATPLGQQAAGAGGAGGGATGGRARRTPAGTWWT